MNKTIGADPQPHVQNRELRRRTGEKIVLRPRASTNYQYRRRVRDRKYHSHEMTSRGRRNGILRQVEKIFRQVQFVRRRSRCDERYIRRWLLCASFIRDMERLRTAKSIIWTLSNIKTVTALPAIGNFVIILFPEEK